MRAHTLLLALVLAVCVAAALSAEASTYKHTRLAHKPVHRIVKRVVHRVAQHEQPAVMIERAETHVENGVGAGMLAALEAMGSVAISAEADASQEAVLQDPAIQAALSAKQPDAVDKLIQGILDGTGKGGVVTSEFNQDGIHATIISNVNELKITQLVKTAAGENTPESKDD